MEHEAKRILINSGIAIGIVALGVLVFFGFLKLFAVLANIPFP